MYVILDRRQPSSSPSLLSLLLAASMAFTLFLGFPFSVCIIGIWIRRGKSREALPKCRILLVQTIEFVGRVWRQSATGTANGGAESSGDDPVTRGGSLGHEAGTIEARASK